MRTFHKAHKRPNERKDTKMKKYYNFETLFRSLKDELTVYLKKHGYKFEISGCYTGWHFEVLASEKGLQSINDYLDSVTIWCKGLTL
jgi:hypothetical protein